MINIPFSINILKEKLFHLSELSKLQHMSSANDIQAKKEPKDFLTETSKENVRRHNSQIEHYAAQFWNHYYQGERPHNILKNRPVCGHQYGNCDPCASMKALMEKPEFASLIPEVDEWGEPILTAMSAAQNKWLHKILLAQTAIRFGNLEEAENQYNAALAQTEMFEDSRMHRAKALMGLANCQYARGKYEEAEFNYGLLAELDTSMISADRKDLESDFAQLADHYLASGRLEKAEQLYKTVLDAWLQKLSPNDPLLARCMNGLGIIYGFENQWQKAEENFSEALKILENQDVPRPLELASVVENLANLYALTDRKEKAVELYSRALDLCEDDLLRSESENSPSEKKSTAKSSRVKLRKAQTRFAC